MRKLFHFFLQNAKSVSIFFDKMRKVFHFFLKMINFFDKCELASTQTLGSPFLERIRKNQNSKYESELLKIIDWFIDCHDSVHSDYVSFVMN